MESNTINLDKSYVKQLESYEVKIYCGMRVMYTDEVNDEKVPVEICARFCDENKVAVSYTKTHFYYPGGDEPGIIVGMINYPRFPRMTGEIDRIELSLAEELMVGLKQFRVSVVMPDHTIMLSNRELERFG